MKIFIDKNTLLNALKLAKSVIGSAGKQDSVNSLANVLIDASKDQLRLVSSDGIVSCSYVIADNIDIQEPGKALVKVALLLNVVSKINQEQIELYLADSSLWIKAKNYISHINIADLHSYPDINFDTSDWSEVQIKNHVFTTSVRKVIHSALVQHERENRLSGIYFDGKTEAGKLRVVATDSFKLSMYRTPYKGEPFSFLIGTRVIELVHNFLKTDEDVVFRINGKDVAIQTNNFLLLCKSIELEYPPIDRVLNVKPNTQIKIDNKKLAEALDRVISFSLNGVAPTSSIKITKQALEISYRQAEVGSSNESVELIQFKGAPIDFFVNASFLLNHVRVFDNDEITINIEQETKPISLIDEREPEFIQILVPMRSN